MSYADVAASGPKQSAEEVFAPVLSPQRAPAPPTVEHTDASTSSLIDVDSPHVSSVPSDFETQSVKTDTQAAREQLEVTSHEPPQESSRNNVPGKGSSKKREGARDAGRSLRDNSDNPVVVGNAVVVAALGGLLGFGAYRKHVAGELTWRVAGLWAGAVGLFGVADYYVSQYFLKRYPTK